MEILNNHWRPSGKETPGQRGKFPGTFIRFTFPLFLQDSFKGRNYPGRMLITKLSSRKLAALGHVFDACISFFYVKGQIKIISPGHTACNLQSIPPLAPQLHLCSRVVRNISKRVLKLLGQILNLCSSDIG